MSDKVLWADKVHPTGQDAPQADPPSERVGAVALTFDDVLLIPRYAEVHPRDVEEWGLEDGGLALMSSRRGEVVVKVSADDTSPRGTVFCSFSFSDVPVNALTGSGYDPITDTAELKVCAVKIEAVTAS